MNIGSNSSTKKIQFALIAVFLFIFVQFFIINFQNNNNFEDFNCSRFVDSDLENSSEIYFDFYNKNIIYQELNLIPEFENFKCLAKQVNFQDKNIIFTSNMLYNFSIISIFIFLLALFLFTGFQNLFIFSLIGIISYFNFTKIFFKEFFINYYLILFLITIFIFNTLIKNIHFNSVKEYLMSFFFSAYTLVLFFDYELFQQMLIFFVSIYLIFFKDEKLSNSQIKLFKYIPIMYYFLRIVSGIFLDLNVLWQRLSANTYQSNDRYADTYYGLSVLNCNAVGCNVENNYGPIWDYIAFENNLEVTSIIFSSFVIIFVVLIYIYIFDNLKNNKFILQVLFIGPPLVFVLERGHLDIYFVLICLLSLLIFKKNPYISYFLLTFSTLIKIYPLFLFGGLIIYFYKNKNIRKLIESSVICLFNAASLIYYYFAVNFQERIQDQSGVSQSYGIQGHAKNYNEFLNFSFILGYGLQILIITLISIWFFTKFKNENAYIANHVYISFSVLFIISSIFGNEDVRLIILYIPILYLLSGKINFPLISCLFLVSSSPSKFFHGFKNSSIGTLQTIYETIPVLISHITFYIAFSYLLYEIINFVLNSKSFKKIPQ
jgi:hypothetical protein